MKKLLILGAGITEIEIINCAKNMGLYTIVTDSNTDWSLAPAKYVADEAWDISWSDIELLKKMCIKNDVTGCIAGFSEKRIVQAQILCTALEKPFYTIGSDINMICDKLLFKQACVDSGIVIPKTYKYGEFIEFPVIVKPVDNGGSKGISICYNEEELKKAYELAMSFSNCGKVLIEEYLTSNEVMVYFTVINGEIMLSAMCDRNMYRFDKNITQLPNGYFYPSRYLDIFTKYNLENYKKLIKHLKISNGLIAFQAFVKGNDVIPFDPTYRLDGTMSYHITSKINGVNVLQMLINYSMNGTMGCIDKNRNIENPYFNKIGFQLPILLGKGKIKEIQGLSEIQKMDDVIFIYQGHNVGEKMEKIADFSQIIFRIHMVTESIEKLIENIEKIYKHIKVLNEYNENMIICRYDINTLVKNYK